MFDGLYSGQQGGGEGARTRARWEILHCLLQQFYFYRQVSIILQTASVRNPYAQINLLSDKENNRAKEPNSYSSMGISPQLRPLWK